MAKPNEEPKTIHLWMPDGRSLCDRRAHPHGVDTAGLSDSDFEAYLQERTTSPICGPCVLVLGTLRSLIADYLAEVKFNGRTIWPAKPADGIKLLDGTRWDLESSKPEDLESEDYYRWFVLDAIDDDWLRERAADEAETSVRWVEFARQQRADALASGAEQLDGGDVVGEQP